MHTTLISSKPYKQWCKARGLDFASYISQFPLLRFKLAIPKQIVKKLTLWEKVKAFFRY